MLPDGFRLYAQKARLGFIPVGDAAIAKHLGGAGDIGEPLCQKPAGAAFRKGDGQVPLLQAPDHHFLQGGHVHAVDPVSQNSPHLLYHRVAQGQGGGPGLRPGGDAQLALALLGIGGHRHAGEGIHQRFHQRLHGAFAHAKNFYIPAPDDAAAEGLQIGQRPLPKHGGTLPGRAGQHDHVAAVLLKGAARSSAPVVHQHGAAPGQHGLFFIVERHGGAHPLLQPGQLNRVHFQRPTEHGGHRLLGEVIRRGAQAAGGDEHIGPPFGDLHRLPQALGVVPHYRLPIHVKAVLVQPPGDDLGVGVDDLAHKQLSAHGQQLTIHTLSPPRSFPRPPALPPPERPHPACAPPPAPFRGWAWSGDVWG